MNRKGVAAGLIFGVSLVLFPRSIVAEDSIRSLPVGQRAEDQAVCISLRTSLVQGTDALILTRTALELGHNPCLVIKCILIGGGDLEKIVTAAIQGGVTSDVISRCAADTGADLSDLAEILAREELGLSICYFPPAGLRDGGASSSLVLPPETTASAGGYSRYTF